MARLKGFSQTARNKYLRLLDYLNALYCPGQPFNLFKLMKTMFGKQEWKLEDIHQGQGKETPGQNKETPYVFRRDEGVHAKPEQFLPEIGEIAMFCKRYYPRANAIRASTDRGGYKDTKAWKAVDRRDVLLLGYFLITGYMAADEKAQAALWALTEWDGPMDRRMAQLRKDLDALRLDSDAKEKQVLCCRILNELLAAFGFHALYVPAAFDRFLLLSLLTGRPFWAARHLPGRRDEGAAWTKEPV